MYVPSYHTCTQTWRRYRCTPLTKSCSGLAPLTRPTLATLPLALSPRPVSQSLLSLCLFPPGLFPMSIFKSKHPFMSQHLRIYPVLSCHYIWRPYFLSSRHIILKVLVWFFHPPSPKSMFLIKLKSAYNE